MVSGGRVQKLFNIIISEPRAFPTNFVKLELNVRLALSAYITSSVTYAPHPVQPGVGGSNQRLNTDNADTQNAILHD